MWFTYDECIQHYFKKYKMEKQNSVSPVAAARDVRIYQGYLDIICQL